MQFNSFVFILLFMPVTVVLYFLSNRINVISGKIVLILSSLVFYTAFDFKLSYILLLSSVLNLAFALLMEKTKKSGLLFWTPVVVNIALLFFFKYTNFSISMMNRFVGTHWTLLSLVQPIGISFFTFQEIAYITAVHKGEIGRISILDYLSYILYFPKILMGPLMDPVDFITQINDTTLKKLNPDNLASGIRLFSYGLFKKVMLADVFQKAVSWGFGNQYSLSSLDWILVTLFYTFEIYFDFSGYSDMATGVSAMLNITLPINFDSPYKALSIRDFWKRWHISLTQFFTRYVYIPLGGGRHGTLRAYINTIFVFILSGLWHGANYTFILWGILNGLFVIIDRMFEKTEKKIFEPVRWALTFCTINVLWLLFRADSIVQWKSIIKTVMMMQNTTISSGLISCFQLQEMPFLTSLLHIERSVAIRGFWLYVYAAAALFISLVPDNNYKKKNRLNYWSLIPSVVLFVWAFICLSSESVFVYFNF